MGSGDLEASKSRSGWQAKLILATGSLVFTLLALEAALRLSGAYSPGWSQPNDVLGWSFIPNMPYKVLDLPEKCPGWGSEGRINSHGLRDYEYDYPKSANTFRILALGDSYTEGFQHPLEYIWPKLLEAQLNSRNDGIRYEVINAGRSGMGTTHEYLYYTHEGYRYSPDLVVLLFISNDVLDDSKALAPSGSYGPYFSLQEGQLVLDDSFKLDREYRLRAALTPIKKVSVLVSYMMRQYNQFRAGQAVASPRGASGDGQSTNNGEINPSEVPVELAKSMAVTQRVMDELNREVGAQGARLVVFNGNWHPFGDEADSWLADITRSAGIPYMDLLPPLKDNSQRSGEYLYGCPENAGLGHWSRFGHAQAAKLMYDYLEANGLVP